MSQLTLAQGGDPQDGMPCLPRWSNGCAAQNAANGGAAPPYAEMKRDELRIATLLQWQYFSSVRSIECMGAGVLILRK